MRLCTRRTRADLSVSRHPSILLPRYLNTTTRIAAGSKRDNHLSAMGTDSFCHSSMLYMSYLHCGPLFTRTWNATSTTGVTPHSVNTEEWLCKSDITIDFSMCLQQTLRSRRSHIDSFKFKSEDDLCIASVVKPSHPKTGPRYRQSKGHHNDVRLHFREHHDKKEIPLPQIVSSASVSHSQQFDCLGTLPPVGPPRPKDCLRRIS